MANPVKVQPHYTPSSPEHSPLEDDTSALSADLDSNQSPGSLGFRRYGVYQYRFIDI